MKNLSKIHCRHLLCYFSSSTSLKEKFLRSQPRKKFVMFMETTPLQKKRAKDGSKDLRKEILILKINNALEGREDSVFNILIQESRRIQKPTPESWLLLSNAHQ